jgi:hypothetical protein
VIFGSLYCGCIIVLERVNSASVSGERASGSKNGGLNKSHPGIMVALKGVV